MSAYDLFPENQYAECYLRKLDHSVAFPSLVRADESDEGDYVVAVSDSRVPLPIRLGAVENLVETFERTEFPATRPDIVPVPGTERTLHVPPADQLYRKDVASKGQLNHTIREYPCAVCPRLVEADENAIAALTPLQYVRQFLHVDCIDEFCEGLERVWDTPEELLVDVI